MHTATQPPPPQFSIASYATAVADALHCIYRQAGGSCDGASVMLGKQQGAMVNIKRNAPPMVVTHSGVARPTAKGWWVW